jgi:diacylglycerol kinase
MTEWTWKFHTAKVADEDGLTDVVKSIGYQLTGTRGTAPNEKQFVIGGETALGAPNPAKFTSFSSLTKAQIVAIVGSVVNIEALKAQIDAWHDEQVKPLPFEAAT